MNGPRRRLLAASGSVVASLAGCLGRVSDGPAGAPESETETTSDEPSSTADGTETDEATDDSNDYPATVEVTTAVERDEIEYVEGNGTVRYVAAYGSKDPEGDDETPPEREPIYEHRPFEEWAETECVSAGSRRVHEAMTDRLDGEAEGVSAGMGREDGEMVVRVAHETILDRDGDVVSEPSVPYERVEAVAPERVEATVTLAGRSHSCTVSVTTREMEIRQE